MAIPKIESPLHKDALCLVEIGPVILEKNIFLILSRPRYFQYFEIISP